MSEPNAPEKKPNRSLVIGGIVFIVMILLLIGLKMCKKADEQKSDAEKAGQTEQVDVPVKDAIIDDSDKQRIIDMANQGMKPAKIAKETGLQLKTVKQILKENKLENE